MTSVFVDLMFRVSWHAPENAFKKNLSNSGMPWAVLNGKLGRLIDLTRYLVIQWRKRTEYKQKHPRSRANLRKTLGLFTLPSRESKSLNFVFFRTVCVTKEFTEVPVKHERQSLRYTSRFFLYIANLSKKYTSLKYLTRINSDGDARPETGFRSDGLKTEKAREQRAHRGKM